MAGTQVAAAHIKNRHTSRLAGVNQQVSAIGKDAEKNKVRYRVRLLVICFLKTEVHAHFMNCCAHSQSTLWIHEHGQTKFSTKFSTAVLAAPYS